MNLGVAFAPLVADYIVWTALVVAIVLAVLLVLARVRGRYVRMVAIALFVLALANPSITQEDRDPLTSVAAVIIDKSPSQEFGDRTAQTEAVRAQLAERLGRLPGIEVRFVEAGQSDGETDGTRLFTALSSVLSDVPHDRVAGAILVTDGRVRRRPARRRARFVGAGACADHRSPEQRDRRVLHHPRLSSANRRPSPSASKTRAPRPAPRRSRCAAMAKRSRAVPSASASRSRSTCRSRTPGPTSSKSRRRRSTTSSRR